MSKRHLLLEKPWLSLLLLYIATVVLHYLLALFSSGHATVGIDEYLYYSIARSVATEGRLLFQGQPADYSFILYPLVISPIYAIFDEGATFYRLIQLWNILLMSLSVFPIYGLCKAMLQDTKKSLGLTALFFLLADFTLGQYILGECIIYPMFFTLLYCAHRYLVSKDAKQALFIGLLGALLFFTKPGAVLPCFVFLGFFLIQGIRKKEKKDIVNAVAGLGAFLAVFVAFIVLVKGVLHYEGTLFSIYAKQIIPVDGLHLDVFLKYLVLYPYYLILSCGILGALYPLVRSKYWQKGHQLFATLIMICLIGMIVGTAWSVKRVEPESTQMHMRYMNMYLPLALLFSCLPTTNEPVLPKKQKQPMSPLVPIVLLYIIACTLIFGSHAGADSEGYPSPACAIINKLSGNSGGASLAVSLLIILGCIFTYFIYSLPHKNNKLKHISIAVMAVFMALNTAQCVAVYRENYQMDIAKHNKNILEALKDKDYIYLVSDNRSVNSIFDVNTKKNITFIQYYDFFNQLGQTDGSYVPFVPAEYRATKPTYHTPDVDTLVLPASLYHAIAFTSYTSVEVVDDVYYIVTFDKEKPLIDCIVGNIFNNTLAPGSTAVMRICNAAYLEQPLSIRFDIESAVSQEFHIHSDTESGSINLAPQRAYYVATFREPMPTYNFSVDQQSVIIHGYELFTGE